MNRFAGFDPNRALSYAKELSTPRLAGTPGEHQAAALIEARLQGAGWQVQRLPFAFSARAEGFLKAGLLLGLLLAGAQSLPPRWPALRLPASALLLLLLGGLPRAYARMRRRQVQPLEGGAAPHPALPKRAENLHARLPGAGGEDLPLLILMAHYDSKSQNLPLQVRVACFSLASLGALACALLSPLGLLRPALLPLARAAGAATLLAGLPLLTLRVGNASPGASDNASGAGLVLHLAEVLAGVCAQQPELLGRLRVECLFTSAEELGLLGALAFIQGRSRSLRRQAQGAGLQVLNFDGVGVQGELYLMGSSAGGDLERALRAGAGRLKRFRLPGALYDHLPFAALGLEAETLAVIGPASAAVHTPADGPHLLHPEGFRLAGEAALAAIAALAEKTVIHR